MAKTLLAAGPGYGIEIFTAETFIAAGPGYGLIYNILFFLALARLLEFKN